jgi:hypothetical protein
MSHPDCIWLASLQAEALLEVQRKSPSGFIELDNQLFDEYVVGKSRPYSIVVVGGKAGSCIFLDRRVGQARQTKAAHPTHTA